MTTEQFEKLLAVLRSINISLGIIIGVFVLLAAGACLGLP